MGAVIKRMSLCIKLDKLDENGAEEHYTEEKVPIIFGITMYCFRNCEVKRGCGKCKCV